MEFCTVCGSHLKRVQDEYWCPKCHRAVECKSASESGIETAVHTKREEEPILVINDNAEGYAKTVQACPECGNKEAYHWFSESLGEHAGVRQERTIEYFRCAKCSYSWKRSS
jgi:DNA-directed RNA polymerase subunit M/transcription elongation factor TFIIS